MRHVRLIACLHAIWGYVRMYVRIGCGLQSVWVSLYRLLGLRTGESVYIVWNFIWVDFCGGLSKSRLWDSGMEFRSCPHFESFVKF